MTGDEPGPSAGLRRRLSLALLFGPRSMNGWMNSAPHRVSPGEPCKGVRPSLFRQPIRIGSVYTVRQQKRDCCSTPETDPMAKFLTTPEDNRPPHSGIEHATTAPGHSAARAMPAASHVAAAKAARLRPGTWRGAQGAVLRAQTRWLLAAVALLALQFVSSSSPAGPPTPARRPNVLLIVADDLGYSDLGCYGGEIRTPHLDQLAADGLRFSQFYNCAVCHTTRAALLTGLHPRQGPGEMLRDNMITLGEALQLAGYQTAMTGKWHLGSAAPLRPIDRGFSEYYGLLSGCCNYFNPAERDPQFYNGGQFRPFFHNANPVTGFPDDFYTTDAFAEHAAGTIRQLARSDQPFFLNLNFTAPHFPLQARPEDIERYRGRYDAGYFALRPLRHQRQIELGLVDATWTLPPVDTCRGVFRHDYEIVPWEQAPDPDRERRRMEVYAAMVDRLDQGVGRVLDALRETGAEHNTLVLFLSDNGGCATLPQDREGMRAYNQDLPGGGHTYDFCGPGWGWAQCTPFRRWKTWNYEGGIATPLIARWPAAIAAGGITHQVGHIVDVMPTLLELAVTTYPQQFHGRDILPYEGLSLVPIFEGRQRQGHAALCWALTGNRAIRQGNWKLVRPAGEDHWELYNMQTDRTETANVADRHPERVAQLAALWNDWARQVEVAGD
jgi:arylsulfatase